MIVTESKNERNKTRAGEMENITCNNRLVSSQYHKFPSYFVVVSQSQYCQEGSPTLVMV